MVNAYSFKGELPRHLRGLTPAQASLWESFRERYKALGSPAPVAAVKAWGDFKRLYERQRDGNWKMKTAKAEPVLQETKQDPHRGAAICESATYPDYITQVGSSGGGLSPAQLSLRPPEYTPDQMARAYNRIIAGMPGVYLRLGESSEADASAMSAVIRTINRMALSGSTRALLDKVETVALIQETADHLDAHLKEAQASTLPLELRTLAEKILMLPPKTMVIPREIAAALVEHANRLYDFIVARFTEARMESFGDHALDLYRKNNGELVEYNEDQPRDENGRWTSGGTQGGLIPSKREREDIGARTGSSTGDKYKGEIDSLANRLDAKSSKHGKAIDDLANRLDKKNAKAQMDILGKEFGAAVNRGDMKAAREIEGKFWDIHYSTQTPAEKKRAAAENNFVRSVMGFKDRRKKGRKDETKTQAISRFRTLLQECNGSTACAPCAAKMEAMGSSCSDEEDKDKDKEKKDYEHEEKPEEEKDKEMKEMASTCPKCGGSMNEATCSKCGYTTSVLEKFNAIKATKALGAQLLAQGKRALKGDTGVNPIRKTLPPASMSS